MTSVSALRMVTSDDRLGDVPMGVALVRDASGEIVGILFPDETTRMNPMQPVGGAYRTLSSLPPIPAGTGLRETLEQLGDRPARLVVDGKKVIGLVHRRDFNRRVAKVHYRLRFSAVEAGLAQLLPPNPAAVDLVEILDETSAIGILGTQALSTWRRGSGDAIEYFDFPSLLQAVRQDEFVQRLGFGSIHEWDDKTEGLGELWRKVQDPLQSLVTGAESVRKVLYADLRIRDLQTRLQKAHVNPI